MKKKGEDSKSNRKVLVGKEAVVSMEGYWAQAIFRCFYKALEITGSINEAAVKKVTFFKLDGEPMLLFLAEEEINATAVRYCRSTG